MFEGINIHLPFIYQLLYLTVQTVQTRVFLSSKMCFTPMSTWMVFFFRQALTTSSSSLQELLNDVSHWAVKILRARYGACYGARYGAHGVWAGN
jgi:hypothetical protein